MPPVLGPRSPSPTRLKSCAGSSGTTVGPSTRQNSDTSGPSRYVSSSTGCPSSSRPMACARAASRSVGDDHALAGGQAVVLDDVGRGEAGELGVEVGRVVDGHRCGGGHAGRGHDVLGEGLRALDPGGGRARPEAGDPGGPHGVGDPGDQRHLGPDHDEVGLPALRPVGDGLRVAQVEPVLLGDGRGTGVAGSAGQRGDGGVLRQGEDEGVLTGTGADDQDAHGQPA